VSGATADYLARLGAWALMFCLAEGVVLTGSWLVWSRLLVRAGAGLRHRVACAHFAGFAVLPLLSVVALQGGLMRAGAETPGFAAGGIQARSAQGLAVIVALAWLTGAAVCAARLISDWRDTRRHGRGTAPTSLTSPVARLAGTLGLRRAPRVSIAAVTAPQVVGWRRPVVLVPADIGERLGAAQLDAVLLHELAHVRFGDFGWNLLQRGLLVLVWFHPGAWFVHGRLRRERELRCDETAARGCRSGADLAMALVRLAEPRAPAAALALSASGASTDLAARVTRLVEPRVVERPWLAAAPIAAAAGLCALAIFVGSIGRSDPGLSGAYLASAFSPGMLIQAHDDAGVFALRVLNGRVVAASVGPGGVPARIVQRGPAVTLIDRAGGPAVSVTVTPQGRIRWESRAPQAPSPPRGPA
jgi:beta-lactamase regulating signal transducer with metallopeptidase domain